MLGKIGKVRVVFVAIVVICAMMPFHLIYSSLISSSTPHVNSNPFKLLGDETGHRLLAKGTIVLDSEYILIVKKAYNPLKTIL